MKTVELKSQLHKLIDQIDSDELLNSVYQLLLSNEKRPAGQLWKSLNEDQKNEVLNAFEESNDAKYLIAGEEMF